MCLFDVFWWYFNQQRNKSEGESATSSRSVFTTTTNSQPAAAYLVYISGPVQYRFLWNILHHYSQCLVSCGSVEWKAVYLVILCNFCVGGKTAAILDLEPTSSVWIDRSREAARTTKREVAISYFLYNSDITSSSNYHSVERISV